jgi:hypothetical protein
VELGLSHVALMLFRWKREFSIIWITLLLLGNWTLAFPFGSRH